MKGENKKKQQMKMAQTSRHLKNEIDRCLRVKMMLCLIATQYCSKVFHYYLFIWQLQKVLKKGNLAGI